MNTDFERRVMAAVDEALEWPTTERQARLADLARQDPALEARVRKLLRADDAASSALPTDPALAGDAAGLDDEDLVPPEQIGVYRVTDLLGQGGMGAVYRGERNDGLFEQSVAIKLVRPGLFSASILAQFGTERRVLARLRHPNIAQLYDGGADAEGRAYFIMELVQGEPLTRYVQLHGLELAAAASLVLPLCAAVQHAHQALVVHADIKPGNILVDGEGRPKLLDFGIARNLMDEDDVHGQGLTLAYASPQRRAGEPATAADDIYALGVILYELAQGEPPKDAPPPPLPASVPAEYAAIVAKAAAADPAARYDSAAAMAEDLRRWMADLPVRALPPSARRTARLFVRRRPLVVGAACAAVIGLVAAFTAISLLYVRADAERREAERRFEQARSMSHYMLFDLFDRLNDTPGTLALRRELADKARAYLQDLSASPHAPPDLKAEAAIGYMQLAGVEGLFSSGSLGDRAGAETSLKAAAALLADPQAGAGKNPRWRHALGRLKLFEGFRLFDQGGAERAALPVLGEAVRRLEATSRDLPGDTEAAIDLWQARLALADAQGAGGDYAAELRGAQAALADYRSRARVYGRSERSPLFESRSHKLIGDARYYLGDVPAAAASYATAEQILVDEDVRHPRRSRTLMELMMAKWNLGTTLAELGRRTQALSLYEAALAAGRERLKIEPDHDGLQRTSDLLGIERAALLAELGRSTEAMAAAAENLQSRRQRRDRNPNDAVAIRGYLASLRQVAQVEAAAGRRDVACAHLHEARDGYGAFMQRFNLSRRTAQDELAAIDKQLAACGVSQD